MRRSNLINIQIFLSDTYFGNIAGQGIHIHTVMISMPTGKHVVIKI
jgi:hypothetical protein